MNKAEIDMRWPSPFTVSGAVKVLFEHELSGPILDQAPGCSATDYREYLKKGISALSVGQTMVLNNKIPGLVADVILSEEIRIHIKAGTDAGQVISQN